MFVYLCLQSCLTITQQITIPRASPGSTLSILKTPNTEQLSSAVKLKKSQKRFFFLNRIMI